MRHKLTGLFYTMDGGVSPYESQAANFETIEAAIRYCQEHGLLDVDLVVKAAQPLRTDGLICTMPV